LLFGEQGAVGVRAMHPAGFDRRELHPPGFGEYDAGTAEGGYRIGFLVDGLHWSADGQPGAAADLAAVGEHHPGAGGDDLRDRRHQPDRLAVRDQTGYSLAGTSDGIARLERGGGGENDFQKY